IISLIAPNTKQRVFYQTIDQMGLSSDKKIVIFSPQHNDLYKTAINITKDNLIFGVGVKNFRNKCDQDKYKISVYSCSTHPHNSYIQLAVELGIIGLFFGFFIFSIFFVFIFKHFRYLFRGKYYFTDFQICLISAILISLWPFAPTGNFFNNWLNIVYYFPVGILLSSMEKMTKFDKN
ncbi:O-antigen ligase family protein, partial [Candidatus Pelagibacter sp.]|nr:O-antigen ligase family protein [Candidatus Pelagibacter sp.]